MQNFGTLLRQDNADIRLTLVSHQIGLTDAQRFSRVTEKQAVDRIIEHADLKVFRQQKLIATLIQKSCRTFTKVKVIQVLNRPGNKFS